METFIILVKLLCAHLLSDFILQTDSINNGKYNQGAKGICFQLLHSRIHAATAYLFVADWSCWIIPVAIFASHFIIDMVKCKFCEDRCKHCEELHEALELQKKSRSTERFCIADSSLFKIIC